MNATKEHGNKGKTVWNKGKTNIYSEETLKKMSKAKKGKLLREEHKQALKDAWTPARREAIAARNRLKLGEKNPNWKGGVMQFNKDKSKTREYQEWRKAVFERDGRICCQCGATEKLHVDHIKRKIDYPELIHDVDNGRILCGPCHRQTDTYGNKKQVV